MNHAFSLVELLTVSAIIAVVAAFAVPSYMRHVTETKVKALLQLAESAKLQVESRYLKQNASLAAISVNSGTTEYTTSNADFVHCITIQSGAVFVVGTSSVFNGKNIWVSWVPTESTPGLLTWNCHYSNDAAEYLTDTTANCSSGTAGFAADAACN